MEHLNFFVIVATFAKPFSVVLPKESRFEFEGFRDSRETQRGNPAYRTRRRGKHWVGRRFRTGGGEGGLRPQPRRLLEGQSGEVLLRNSAGKSAAHESEIVG
jgi:hypothetical protein